MTETLWMPDVLEEDTYCWCPVCSREHCVKLKPGVPVDMLCSGCQTLVRFYRFGDCSGVLMKMLF